VGEGCGVVRLPREALDRLRKICLAFPEATEAGGVGDPTFRVRDKIFAMQHGVEGRATLWCKAPPGAQAALVGSNPSRFFVPPYVGCHGWVGMWLDIEIDWDEVADLVEESYRMTAPKRLSRLLDRG
jgi:predicted DNA-binding protein (MmcQ/YjbR family)